MPKLTADQQELADLMSSISEDWYAAGWIHGNEYIIWHALTEIPVDESYLTGFERSELNRLSKSIDGWIIWDDSDEKFVSMQDWIVMYANRENQ